MTDRLYIILVPALLVAAASAVHCRKNENPGLPAAINADRGTAGAANVKVDEAPARYIVRTASLTIRVGALDRTRMMVERLASELGGFVHTARYTAGTSDRKWKVTLKVPQDRLQGALGKLRALGKVLEESLSSEEITQAVLDVRARLKNHRSTEQRLQEIAVKSTGSTEDLLKVEQHLDRVRSQIEQLEAKDRHYTRATAMATIQVELVLSEPRKMPGAWARLGDAFESGFGHVKNLVVLLLEVIGHSWLVVLLLVVLTILGIRVARLLWPTLSRLIGTEPGRSPAPPVPASPSQTFARAPMGPAPEPLPPGADIDTGPGAR